MTPEWRMLRVPGGRGLVVVAESAQDAATILSLRDARLGHGAGTFLVDLIDGLLVADVWSAVGVLAGLRVRDALLVDPASREPRSLLADAGVRAYGMLRPEVCLPQRQPGGGIGQGEIDAHVQAARKRGAIGTTTIAEAFAAVPEKELRK